MSNLEDYVLLLKNATIGSGISCQLQAFRLGFNQVCITTHFLQNTCHSSLMVLINDDTHEILVFQVFPIEHLRVFSEELELILCGEPNSWTVCITFILPFSLSNCMCMHHSSSITL